jgi:hypothetical protein
MGNKQSKLHMDIFPYSQSCVYHNDSLILDIIQTNEDMIHVKQSNEIDDSTSQIVHTMQQHIIPSMPHYDIDKNVYTYQASIYTDPPTPWNINWEHRLKRYHSYHYGVGKMMYDGNPSFYIPLHPHGIQGTKGKGLLQKWGPNINIDLVLTIVHPTNKSMNIVLQRFNHTKTIYGLPSGNASANEDILPKHGAFVDLLQECMGDEYVTNLVCMCMGDKPGIIYSGIVEDVRNTDNAWLETKVLHYHILPNKKGSYQKTDGIFSCLKRNPLFEICPVSNIPYNDIYKPHTEYIKKAIGQNLSEI